MEKLKTDKQTLKDFGFTMGIAFLVITSLIFIRHRHSIIYTSLASGAFFLSSVVFPLALKPFYIIWMRLAFALGKINTKIILILMYYLVFTPVSIALKIMKKDLLNKEIDKTLDSYWIKKEKNLSMPLNYERQF